MTTLQKTIVTASVVVLAGAGIYEARQAAILRDQNQALQQQQASAAERIQALQRERDEAANRLAALAGETGSRNSNELLKLRGEVGRLRREAEIAAQEANELRKDWSAMTNYIAHLAPVKTFVATTMTTVPWQQAIVTGGWKTPSGKRAIVLATPERGADAQQLTIKSFVLEYAEDAGKTLGLPQFKLDEYGGQAAYEAHPLTADQFEVLMRAARNNEGVEIVATPTVTTGNGRMTETQALDIRSAAFGGQYSTGPVLNFIPTISPDGQSVQLILAARLNYSSL